jgi:hypothetical protein
MLRTHPLPQVVLTRPKAIRAFLLEAVSTTCGSGWVRSLWAPWT